MKLSAILCLLGLSLVAMAQPKDVGWGEISTADLQLTTYEKDTSAAAVVLADNGLIGTYNQGGGVEYHFKHHRVLKILRKQAIADHGDISIPYYHYDNTERLDAIKAQVHLPSGRKYVLDRKDFFYEKINDKWTALKFSFPNLVEGAIIEYEYQLVSKYVAEPRAWYFQEDIPVRLSKLRFINDSRLSYVTLYQGGEYLQEQEKHKDGTVVLAEGDTRYTFGPGTYIMENAPALKEEAYITTLEDYRYKIRFQLSEIFRMDGSKETFLSSWEEVAEDLPKKEFFGEKYMKKRYFKDLINAVTPLLDPAQSKMEKVEVIYDFIATHIQWNGRSAYTSERELDDVFKAKEGTSAEINFSLLALLNHFDIIAYPVLTSTRDHGRMSATYPILDQFNYVFVCLENGNNLVLLDATDPLRPIGMIAAHAYNEIGWVVNADNPSWIKLNLPTSRDFFMADLQLNEQGDLSGSLKAEFTSYSALQERKAYRADSKGSYWVNRLDRFFPEAYVETMKAENGEHTEEKFINELQIKIPQVATVANDYLYFSPYIYSNFQENPFQSKSRSYPVNFPYPFSEKHFISVRLPTGYQVEELPDKAKFSLPDQQGSLSFFIEDKGDRVTILSELTLSATTIAPDAYQQLKAMLDLYFEKMEAQVVLKKT